MSPQTYTQRLDAMFEEVLSGVSVGFRATDLLDTGWPSRNRSGPEFLRGDMSQRMMHEQFVDRWMTGGSSVLAFERGLAAVWKRCDLVLGVVTLRAVADRVLAVTHEAYPWMHAVALEGDGFDLSRLRAGSSVPAAETLAAGLKFLLLELLTILGKLTGEMITPALHADLAAVERPKSSDGNKESGP